MNRFKIIFQIAGVYATIIIGAGFASGQELNLFFVRFGNNGILGLIISGIIFALTGCAVLDICRIKKISDYKDFVDAIMGKKLGSVFDVIVSLFLFILYSTMIAAGGAAFNQVFGLSFSFGACLFGMFCFAILLFDLKGIVQFNSRLAPVLVAGGIFIGLYTFYRYTVDVFAATGSGNWLVSSLLYTSYNLITAVSVLAAMGGMVKDKHTAFGGGFAGGVALTLLGFSIAFPLFLNQAGISSLEVPMLKIASDYGILIKYLYFIILLIAAITTAAANGYALLASIRKKTSSVVSTSAYKAPRLAVTPFLLTIAAVIFAHFGFSNFISTLYPICGYIGAAEIILIFICWFRCR